jgi:hypothetical protein
MPEEANRPARAMAIDTHVRAALTRTPTPAHGLGPVSIGRYRRPMRVDKWLWTARLFKTRALAAAAVKGGSVRGRPTKRDRRRYDAGRQ